MSIFAWLSLISFFSCIGTAVVVFHVGPRIKVNRYFAVSNVGLALYTFSEFMYRSTDNMEVMQSWIKIHGVCLFALILFLLFAFVFTGRESLIRHPLVILLAYVPFTVFLVLGLMGNLTTGTPQRTGGVYLTWRAPDNPLVYNLFNSWLLLLGLFIFTLFAVFFAKTREPRRRAQAKYFVLGFVPIVAAGTVELILSFYEIIIPSTVSTTLVWLNLCIGFAIWRERLFVPDAAAAADDIVAGMTDPLALIDRGWNISRVNPAFRALFGYEDREILGRTYRLLFARDADESGIPERLAAGQRLEQLETVLVTKTGEKVHAVVSGGAIGRRHRTAGGCVLLIHDITRRWEGEKQLQRLAVDLEHSNRELEGFVSAASHDLKEPLRKIFIYGEKLLESDAASLGNTQREQVQRMTEAATRMRRLIEGLLDYSLVARGAARPDTVDLNQVLKDTLADLEIPLKQSGGTVEAEPLPVLRADPLLMHQLFQNLIGNAVKYHRPGVPPVIRITARTDSGTSIIRVADNGIGFNNAHRDRMFRIFQRLVGRNEYEGAGIGLAICRKIVEQHGGRISASGTPGTGSVFTVELPRDGRRDRD